MREQLPDPRLRDGVRAALPLIPGPRALRALVRRPRRGGGDERRCSGDDVRDHVRRLVAVRSRIRARGRGNRLRGGRLGRAAQRPLRGDERRRCLHLPGEAGAPLRRVAADRRRVVGALGAVRPLRVADPGRGRVAALRPVGHEHVARNGRGRRARRSERSRARRGVRGSLSRPGAAVSQEQEGAPGRRPRGSAHTGAHPGVPGGSAARRGCRRLSAGAQAAIAQ